MIIGIVGLIGSGKTTAGEILQQQFGFVSESFAKPLKDAVAIIFGWPRDMVEGATAESRAWRDRPDQFWSDALGWAVTPRKVLQMMGTEAGRQVFGQNLWTASLIGRLRPQYNYVITDVRFANEIAALKQVNATIVRIRRGPEPAWLPLAYDVKQGLSKYETDLRGPGHALPHISEWDWIGEPIDVTIDNDGTIDELRAKISALVPAAT